MSTPKDDNGNGNVVPRPDPTKLTTDQLIRELLSLRELIEARLDAMDGARDLIVNASRERLDAKVHCIDETGALVRTIIETRLDGMDKAIQLLQAANDKFPERIDEKIEALRLVHTEKFDALLDLLNEKLASVQKQFEERDVRTEQAAGAVKIAVDAALQAQKEAASENSKSNQAATTKSEISFTKLLDAQGTLITNMTKAFDDKISDVKDRVNRIEGGWGGASWVIGLVIAAAGILIGLSRFLK